MTITILNPATGNPMGFGCHMIAHEDLTVVSGDLVVGELY